MGTRTFRLSVETTGDGGTHRRFVVTVFSTCTLRPYICSWEQTLFRVALRSKWLHPYLSPQVQEELPQLLSEIEVVVVYCMKERERVSPTLQLRKGGDRAVLTMMARGGSS